MAKICVVLTPSDDRLQEGRAWNMSGGPHCREGILTLQGAENPRVLWGLCTVPSAGLTFTGCQKFLVLLGTGVGGVAERPPHPLGSTHHSGSKCMSLGSSVGCTGSGLLKCCCAHIDSLHAGGRGCHCGASSAGSGGALYCSGPPSWWGGGASALADSHRTWSVGSRKQWDTWLFPQDMHTRQRGAQDSQPSSPSRPMLSVDPSRARHGQGIVNGLAFLVGHSLSYRGLKRAYVRREGNPNKASVDPRAMAGVRQRPESSM